MQLVIGSKRLSSWSLRPWLLLRHCNLSFEEIVLPLDTPEFYARIGQYSPSGRVPVLIDGQARIWDSLAICEYVNERLDGAAWPADEVERGWARSISMEMHSGFAELRRCWIFHAGEQLTVPLTNGAASDLARVDSIWTECLTRFGGPWLFGSFSIADAMYAPVALRCVTYGAKLSPAGTRYVEQVLGNAHIEDWIEAARREQK